MATEAPNTLRSRARFKIIDIISEGPIKGLVNAGASVFLDGTPAVARNGTRNFPNFDFRRSVTELPIPGVSGVIARRHAARFPFVENEVSVGLKVTKDSPEGSGSGDGSIIRTITDPSTTSARVTVRVPALTTQNLTTGDITGGLIRFKILVRPDGGAFRPVSSSADWIDLATWNAETEDGATALSIKANIRGNTTVHRTASFQYRKKTGGVWGSWVTFDTYTSPATTPAAENTGWFGGRFTAWATPVSVEKWVPVEAGIYQMQVVGSAGTTVTPISAQARYTGSTIIQGKTVSPYDASYEVELPEGGAPWDIKVERVSADTVESNLQSDLFWLSYTEIIENKFSWPNLAGLELSIDAEDFGGQIPERAYDVYGMLIKIPTNYNPYARTYNGIWDGTFKTDWTDNPAWIFYDLLTNKRYGLGDNIEEAQIDKFGLYQIAQYCDELVEAPDGNLEARYTCSLCINSQAQAYEVLTGIASAFRGMIYWSGGKIVPVADMPKDPTAIVGPANVIDGMFNYQGAARKARHSVARVSWNNPDDGYKLNVELYEDEAAIRKYGYNPIDVNAYGCTSRGLARRWAKWAISADNDVPDIVTYQASFDHHAVRPGDVVAIADPSYSGEELFGRIVDIVDNEDATHTITLDREVVRIGGDESELQLVSADGDPILIDASVISTTTSDEIMVDSTELAAMPIIGSTWLLKKETVEPRLWRVFSVVESDKNIFQVSAAQYDPNLYDKVESDLNFAEADFTAFPSGEMPAPVSLQTSEFLKQSGSSIVTAVTFSWTRPNDPRADRFEVQFRLSDEDWQTTTPNITELTSIDILNTIPADYDFRVRAIDTSGLFRSEWATITGITLLGKDKEPEDVTGFTAIIEKYGVLLNWSPVSDIDINYYEIRMGGTDWDDATFVGRTAGTTYKYEDQTTATLTFRIKARDTNDNWSINATSTNSTGETQNVPTVTTISIPIGIQVDIAGELKRGFSHWELRRRVYSTQVVSVINARITTRIYFDEAYDDLVFGEAYEYSARAVDTNNVASAWSAFSSPVFPLQIQSNDITADQIVAKDFRTAQDVGATVDGVKFTADGIEMWEDGARKVFIPVTGDPEFTGLLTAGAGHIGGWEIFLTYLQSNNIRLDSAGILQTLDFVSGHKGWKINQDGNAEFNNLRARGAVKTVVFEKDEISVVGGKTLIIPAGIVTDYDYTDFINAAANVYLEECWDKLNTLLGTSYTYVASVFADYDEYVAVELAYYNKLGVAMGFNQFTCAFNAADYSDVVKDAYLTACWAQLMTLLDLTTATPAIPSMTFAAYETLENGYFDEVATAIDNPPLFEPFINDSDTAIETENADQFKVGDIVRVKDGLANDYGGRISAISGDMLSITGEYGEPFAITAGQTIVNYGIPGSGGILLDGQAPLIDVYTHSGAPWNGTDIRLRIGNLNGWGTINDNIYGIAIGQPDGEYLVYDSTSGRLRLNGAIQISEGSGIANFSDAGALAGLDDIDLSYVTDAGAVAGADNLDGISDGTTHKKTTANEKTGAGRAYSGLDSSNRLVTAVIPTTAVTPAGAGLFLGSNYLGYHSGSAWRTYMDNNGNFALDGAGAHGLSWNAATGTLTVAGDITVEDGAITTAKLATGAITAEKINVTALKAPAGAVASWSAKGSTTASIAVVGGVKDVSGNGNHGRAFGGVAVVDSEVGKAFAFDGVNGTGIVQDGSFAITNEITLSAWFRANATDSIIRGIISRYAIGGRNRRGITASIRYGVLQIFYGDGTATSYSWVPGLSVSPNQLYHVAVVASQSANTISVYVDGAFLASTTPDVQMVLNPNLAAAIGQWSNDFVEYRFNGLIAHPRIYDRALTAAEIKTLYMLGTDTESGTITADRVVTGELKSLNYSTTAGSMLDLDNGNFTVGGSNNPVFTLNAAAKTGSIAGMTFASGGLETTVTSGSSTDVIEILTSDFDALGFYVRRDSVVSGNNQRTQTILSRGGVFAWHARYNGLSWEPGDITVYQNISIEPGQNATTSGAATFYSSVSATAHYGMATNGRIHSDGGYYPTSDETVKSEISDVSVLNKLKTLPVKQFCLDECKLKARRREKEFEANIKNSNAVICETTAPEQPEIEYKKQRRIGTMAADFNRIFGTCAGETETFDLTDAIGVALRAIQELSAIVDAQKATIKDLCAKLHIAEPAYPVEPEYYLTREEQELIDLADKQTPEQRQHMKKVLKEIEELEKKKP